MCVCVYCILYCRISLHVCLCIVCAVCILKSDFIWNYLFFLVSVVCNVYVYVHCALHCVCCRISVYVSVLIGLCTI